MTPKYILLRRESVQPGDCVKQWEAVPIEDTKDLLATLAHYQLTPGRWDLVVTKLLWRGESVQI